MRFRLLAVVFTAVVLSACGSGNSNNPKDTATDVEPNNEHATAQAVTLPVTVTGTVNVDSDPADVYTFTLEESGSFTIALGGFSDPNDLDLYVGESTTIYAYAENVGAAPEVVEVWLEAGVPYFVGVVPSATDGNAPYTLIIAPTGSGKAEAAARDWKEVL